MNVYEIDYCSDEFFFGNKTDPMKVATACIEAWSQCDAETEFALEYGENETIVKIRQLPEGSVAW